MLHSQGRIRLRYRPAPRTSWTAPPPMLSRNRSQLRVVIDDTLLVHYDVDDSSAIAPKALAEADVYFKRMLPSTFEHVDRVLPLGLNYPVSMGRFEALALRRWVSLSRNAGLGTAVAGARAALLRDWRQAPPLNRIVASARLDATPLVIFVTRTWDPAEAKSDSQRSDRIQMNGNRVKVIRLLRANLGPRFVGGLEPSALALSEYPDSVWSASQAARKGAYLKLMHGATIGVATQGLHQSIGWKLGEYVSASKAILSESFDSMLPGNFSPGRNYLPFHNADSCVERAIALMESPEVMWRMMTNNENYYSEYLSPAAIVGNSLISALGMIND